MSGRGGGKTPEWVVEIVKTAVMEYGQHGAARRIGVVQNAVVRWLKGIGEPNLETMQKLVNFSGKEVIIKLSPEIQENKMKMFKKEGLTLDWCHICGKRKSLFTEIYYPENAEHQVKDEKYLRICIDCTNESLRVISQKDSGV